MIAVASFGMYLLTLFDLKRTVVFFAVFVLLFLTFTPKSYAGSLIGAKDTVSTSRPSASSPLNETPSSSDAEVNIYNNGSRFLASDSAKIIHNSGIVLDNSTIVASQSAALTTVYFGEAINTSPHNGIHVLYHPSTALHTIEFTTPSGLNSGDDIVITFPVLASGDANNTASPSATTFQLNGVGSGSIQIYDDAADITGTSTFTTTNPSAGTSPIISVNLGAAVGVNSVIRIFVGCTAASSTTCTTQAPSIINPTKSTTAGNDDAYKIRVETQDAAASQAVRDFATVSVGINESVVVRATVDPTLTFTITGINNNTAINSANTGCSLDETTNSGVNSDATDVNLGILANTPSINTKIGNIAAQTIAVTTNGPSGYTLTATSSSSLRNPASGFFLNASTTPLPFPAASTNFFGLHACGNDVQAGTGYVEGGGAGTADCDTHISGSAATECNYAWPTNTGSTNTTPLAVASDTTGPIGSGTGETGDGITSVSYAAGTDATIPPGEYRAIVTYIATPSF